MSLKNMTLVSVTTGTMVRAVLVAVGFLLIWLLRDIVLVVLTSIVIASFVESSIPFFKKIRIGRVLGVVILYVLSLVGLAWLFYLFAPILITEIYNFSQLLSSVAPQLNFLHFFSEDAFTGASDIIANLSNGLSFSTLLVASEAFVGNLSGGLLAALSAAFGGVFNVGLMIVISFYLSIQEKGIQNFLRLILPLSYEDYGVDLWERTSKKIALWVKGQMLLGLIVAILTYIVLSLLGIEYALLLALIAGAMELVPYGILIAVVPAIAFSYLSGGLSSALIVAAAYFIIHQLELFIFTPLIVKRVVGLSPLVVILSVLIGLELAGFWGLILAIPFAVCFMELVDDHEKHKMFKRANNDASTELVENSNKPN